MLARSLFAALLLCACSFASAQPGQAPNAQAPDAQAPKHPAPTHIHVIGASVSGGFRDGPMFGAKEQGHSIALRNVLKKWSGGEVKVSSHPSLEMWAMYGQPVKIGKKEVALAKRRKADLVVAIDFPFWFAYGYVRGEEKQARLALQDECFALIKSLKVPVIIGDLPNMKGAVLRMLNPRQIPSDELLKVLNERLKKFADDNALVTQVSLANLVKQLKDDGVILPLKDGPLKTAPCALLQEDRLHATRLGMAMMGFRLQDALRGHFPKHHALHEQRWAFEQFVEAAGAEEELETLQEQEGAK